MDKFYHKKKNIYSGEYVQMGIAQLVFITLNVTKLILRLKICTLRIKNKCFAKPSVVHIRLLELLGTRQDHWSHPKALGPINHWSIFPLGALVELLEA